MTIHIRVNVERERSAITCARYSDLMQQGSAADWTAKRASLKQHLDTGENPSLNNLSRSSSPVKASEEQGEFGSNFVAHVRSRREKKSRSGWNY